MQLRSVTKADIAEINDWHAARGAPVLDSDMIPKHGVIVPGVAAGFLITTDAQIGLLEGYVSNPSANNTLRSAALNEITRTLLEIAHKQGLRRMLAVTKHPKIIGLCREFGFEHMNKYEIWGRG